MRVEQRIGRIDRIGQAYATVNIHNFYYDGTVEAKVYRILLAKNVSFESKGDRIWELTYKDKTYPVTFYPDIFNEKPSLRLMNFGDPLFEQLLARHLNLAIEQIEECVE